MAQGLESRAWVATRKGLFELQRRAGTWAIARVSFLAEPVSMVLPPDAEGRMLAALNLGHFGVKVHASDDAGATWHEVATPTYPEQPEGSPGPAGCSAPMTAARAGSSMNRCGRGPSGSNGSAAATTCPASIRSARTPRSPANC